MRKKGWFRAHCWYRVSDGITLLPVAGCNVAGCYVIISIVVHTLYHPVHNSSMSMLSRRTQSQFQ